MSSYTEGQIHQLANAFEKAGYTPDELRELGQSPETLRKLRGVLCGTHEITSREGSEDDYDPLDHPDVIKKTVEVNYNRSRQEALDATRSSQYTNDEVVAAAPVCGEGVREKEVFFIPFHAIPSSFHTRKNRISDDDLQTFFDAYNFVSADLHTAAKISEDDPGFSDEHQYGIHFQDEDENWCWADFGHWAGESQLNIDRLDDVWEADWWFVILRKNS